MAEDARRVRNWRRWGPYLADRQWGTVREDYSDSGDCWDYLPHDHARSRAYRWGEDGLLGICDRECRLCFSIALWNGKDPILKERLFGLGGPEGNHGEDVKELYYFLDATPTCSYLKGLYKYPHEEYPYAQLVAENRRRGKQDPEFEIEDTGVFDRGYWDVFVEYAKAGPDDILIELTVANRGQHAQTLHLLPHLWLRNTWSWGRHGEGYDRMGAIDRISPTAVRATQPTLGNFRLDFETAPSELLFTDNETNYERLFHSPGPRFSKDACGEQVVRVAADSDRPRASDSNVIVDARRGRALRRRWLVERFFAWIQWQRRILVRWEYYAQNFLGFVQLACLVVLFRRF